MCMYVSVFLPQNSLGGNAKTALVVTITGNPDHAQETLSTLQFGTRAKQVIVRAQVNEVVDYKALYDALLAKREQGEDNTTALTLATQQSERRAAQLQEEVDELKKVSHHPLPRHEALQSAWRRLFVHATSPVWSCITTRVGTIPGSRHHVRTSFAVRACACL